jgi:signal transduction histidine kinase
MSQHALARGDRNAGPNREGRGSGQQPGDRSRPLHSPDEPLRFETLLAELSAHFVSVAADQVDAQIEEEQRRLVEFLGVDRSSFGEFSAENKELRITHSYVAPGAPPFPLILVDQNFPWYAEQMRKGEVLRFERLPEGLPAEAAREKEYCVQTGFKSHLTIPLKVGGSVLCVLMFGSFRVNRSWPDELVQRLRLVGEIIASAVARKRADEALRAKEHQLRTARDNLRVLAGLLLQAQEEERRRIAREMHDDWTQRLAVLAIDTARMEQEPGLGPSALAQLQAMRGELVGLSEDVHALSRQLHPSILDDLGLADALLSECASFARREGIAVDYRPEGVPASVPKEVALCVYRVAQEALRNIARHARVTAARVSLAGTGRDLLLSVQDEGAGFDPAGARSRPALGLSSMEERVRLIQAELSVRSAPGRGTTVTVRVPLTGRGS